MRRQKIPFFYPTGMISLIFLATLSTWHLNEHKVFERLRAKEVNWASDDSIPYHINGEVLREAYYEVLPKNQFRISDERIYTHIHLNHNDNENKVKLDFAQLAIREMIATNDTLKGIHISFDDKANFWTLIRALDICEIENAKIYWPENNNLWVVNQNQNRYVPKREEFRPFCGYTIKTIQQELEWQEEINYLINSIKPFWLAGVFLLLILISGFVRIWRWFKV